MPQTVYVFVSMLSARTMVVLSYMEKDTVEV